MEKQPQHVPGDPRSILTAEFFERDVTTVAVELLGKLLCRRSREGLTVGRILETEAYLAEGDSAAHSFKGINRKNASMFGPAGRAYVYTIHARQCFNIVTEGAGRGSAVLIRAVEPTQGIDLMRGRRGTDVTRDLCRGPARLCEAFEIGRDFDGWDLQIGRRLWIEQSAGADKRNCDIKSEIRRSVRIGVTSAQDMLLRFFLSDCPFVSGTRKLNTAQSESLLD